MTRWVIAAVLVLVVVLWVLGRDDNAPELSRPAHEEPATERTPRVGSPSVRPGRAEEPPALIERDVEVVLDTGPRRPDEPPQRYRYRQRFVTAFEATRKTAALTDEQVDAILLAIYDYEQNMETLDRDRAQAREEGREPTEEDWVPLLNEQIKALSHRIDAVLEPWQKQIWRFETCRYCFMDAGFGVVRRADTDDAR